jgi:hypothetical protein
MSWNSDGIAWIRQTVGGLDEEHRTFRKLNALFLSVPPVIEPNAEHHPRFDRGKQLYHFRFPVGYFETVKQITEKVETGAVLLFCCVPNVSILAQVPDNVHSLP